MIAAGLAILASRTHTRQKRVFVIHSNLPYFGLCLSCLSVLSIVEAVYIFFSLPRWVVHMEGAAGTLYEGEKFQLQFKFSPKYPFDSPEVRCTFF